MRAGALPRSRQGSAAGVGLARRSFSVGRPSGNPRRRNRGRGIPSVKCSAAPRSSTRSVDRTALFRAAGLGRHDCYDQQRRGRSRGNWGCLGDVVDGSPERERGDPAAGAADGVELSRRGRRFRVGDPPGSRPGAFMSSARRSAGGHHPHGGLEGRRAN
jgi:hypothetical protein